MEFSAQDHQRLFADFAAKIQVISGATPHLLMVGRSLPRRASIDEIVWRGGLYAAVYNYAAAEALWLEFPSHRDAQKRAGNTLTNWVRENWKGLPLRKERKAVNSPAKLAKCILSFARWQDSKAKDGLGLILRAPFPCDYLQAWDAFQQVYGMGRYVSIRFLEYMSRYGGMAARMFDSRAKGGKYPRQGLSLLFPEASAALLGDDSYATVQECDRVAQRCLDLLGKKYGVDLDHYSLQSMICEYKQAALGGKQYPVQALDSELGYYNRVADFFSSSYRRASQFFKVREGFRHEALAEKQNWAWRGKRKELGRTLRDYGYNWSDVEYDYAATLAKGSLEKPVRR